VSLRQGLGENTVAHYFVRQWFVEAALAGLLASCGAGNPGPKGSRQFTPDIQGISEAIATGAHYPRSEIRLRISVSDINLAMSDETTRNNAAAALVAVAEQVLASHPEYAKLHAISVAIIHPSAGRAASSEWHIEDVVEFRKGPPDRFSVHIT
jgi:hypothetical protein